VSSSGGSSPRPKHRTSVENELTDIEYVIDRLVSHAVNDNGNGYMMRVRWAGYDRNADTWEPVDALPASMLRAYERRKKMVPGELSQAPAKH
jgi:Chromo (CHRromatin Organisation MOdifier) domain